MHNTWSTCLRTNHSLRFTRQMHRWGMVAVTVAFLTTALAPTGAMQEANGVRHRVEIRRLKYVPASLVVAPGDTVVWVNLDLVPHTVTAKDDSWDSQALASNGAWEIRVTEAMSGHFFCRYHPSMEGQVHVRRK